MDAVLLPFTEGRDTLNLPPRPTRCLGSQLIQLRTPEAVGAQIWLRVRWWSTSKLTLCGKAGL